MRANLYKADLSVAQLVLANFSEADLRKAFLHATHILGTNFNASILTGSCIKDWSFADIVGGGKNYETTFLNIDCDYIFLDFLEGHPKYIFSERRPHTGEFKPGDFERLIKKVQGTVDLIFSDGIDWKAFLEACENLQAEADGTIFSIRTIDSQSDGSFVIRLQVPPELNKAEIQKYIEEKYKRALKIRETKYRKELNFRDREIEIYKRENTNLWEMVKLKASQPFNIIQQQGDAMMSGNKDIQIVRGDNNRTAKGDNSTFVQGDNNQISQGEQVSTTEVIEMLAYLEDQIQNLTALPETEREKSIKRLEAAKVEASESEPDKESIAKSLKRVNETLNEAGKTTEEVKELVKALFPTVVKVAGWLGYAAGKIWMTLP
jgi:hypothetical protein